MRPGEILGLRTGCCPAPASGPDGRPGRHLIRGHEYKTATDEDGNHQSGGAEREAPWVAITPVVNAIRVLERMVPAGHLLFDHHAHDLPGSRAGTGSLKVSALRDRIEDFVTWANREAASHGLAGEVIPADPHGNIGLSRFRRSLAWHIARLPTAWSPWPSSTGTCAPPSTGQPRDTAPAAATASTTLSTSRPPARSPTPLRPCTTTSETAAAYPGPLPAAPSRPPPRPPLRRHPHHPRQRPQAAGERGRHDL